MVVVRAFLALLAGFAVMMAGGLAFAGLLQVLAPGWAGLKNQTRPGPFIVHLGTGFLSAAAGGYVTAWIASGKPLKYMTVLGIIVLAITALSALQSRGKQPGWYALGLVVLCTAGVVVGVLVRLRVMGVL